MKTYFRLQFKTLILLAVALGLVVSSAIVTVWYARRQTASNQTAVVLGEQTEEFYELPGEPPQDLNTLNVLLLGYGGAGHQGGYLADVIQVAHFDFAKQTLKFISIPRDLWVNLPNGQSSKINTALTLGTGQDKIASGAQIAKQMAQIVTGLKIDYFISVDFVGYKRAVGQTLGGLEVEVPETLRDPWYPIEGHQLEPCGHSPQEIAQLTAQYSGFELEKQFPCRYEEIYYPKGLNKMEGQDALNYVRSRHGSDGGDFSRSERQVAVLKAIQKKLFTLEVFKKLPQFFADLSRHTQSDIDWKIAEYLAPALAASRDFEVNNLVLSTQNVFVSGRSSSGQSILKPKDGWDQVNQFVRSQLE